MNDESRRRFGWWTLRGWIDTRAPAAVVLIRLSVGIVFAAEGIQKFLYPDALGAGRFAKIGIPAPEVMGPFVGAVELVCGTLVLAGLLTRAAAVPLVVDMVVALLSTKIPILLGYGFWGFTLRQLPHYGLWSMLHEARTDLAMLLGSLFLLAVGAGTFSVDVLLSRRLTAARLEEKRDGAAFDEAFGTLTETCNACHQAEKMRFIRVAPPPVRTSVVVAPAEASR